MLLVQAVQRGHRMLTQPVLASLDLAHRLALFCVCAALVLLSHYVTQGQMCLFVHGLFTFPKTWNPLQAFDYNHAMHPQLSMMPLSDLASACKALLSYLPHMFQPTHAVQRVYVLGTVWHCGTVSLGVFRSSGDSMSCGTSSNKKHFCGHHLVYSTYTLLIVSLDKQCWCQTIVRSSHSRAAAVIHCSQQHRRS